MKGGGAMGTKQGAVIERPVTRSACKHHWVIEPPDGPTSKGVCKVCGEVKVFDNILEDLLSIKDSSTPFEPGESVHEEEDAGVD
jgi:hypothetical protein